MWRFRQTRDRPEGRRAEFDTNDDAVRKIVDATAAEGHTKLSEPDAMRVLEAYGVPVLPWRFVAAEESRSLAAGAAAAAQDIGLPVALKIVSPDIVHKTEVPLRLHLHTRSVVQFYLQ